MHAAISVILPIYNAAPWLGRCLDSLSAQTFRDFEVIAVDDGSTDGSGQLLDDYAATFPILRLHQTNQGASVARNVALEKASGDYVLMADADDFLHPRALEFIAEAVAEKPDIVVFDYDHLPETDALARLSAWRSDMEPARRELVPRRPLTWFVAERRLPGLWQFAFRRSTLAGRRFLPGVMFEDHPFVYGCLARAGRATHIRKSLYCYVKTAGSVMRRTPFKRMLTSLETVMNATREAVGPRDYRLLARYEYFGWIKDFWRKVERDVSPEEARAYEEFLGRIMRTRLIRLGDCPLKWYLRFWKRVCWR